MVRLYVRPHVRTHKRTGWERFLVIGSDGLWDNLDLDEVTDILRHQTAFGAAAETGDASGDAGPTGVAAPPEQECQMRSQHSRWQAVAERAAAAMLERALRVRKKPDDITCVVVVLSDRS